MKKKYKTIDLFAGIGGIRRGFESSGFETVFANDFDKDCAVTYNLNYKTTKLTVDDIHNIDAKKIPKYDVLLGGFPCQAFSIAGYRKGFEDERGRGNLFFEIARIIKETQPRAFLLENVKNLKSHDKGNTYKVIEETLTKKLGYYVKPAKIMNSMEYGGVPQSRERIYIVGFKSKEDFDRFEYPEPIPLVNKNIKSILEDKVDQSFYYEGKPLFEKMKDIKFEEGKVYQWRRVYLRVNKKDVCPTLTANMGMGGHNIPIVYDGKGVRKLTPRECARLQGFDDKYKLPENLALSKIYKQMGNSVTVTVIRRVAEAMYKALQ